jgi:hypothetical protein
MMTAHGNRSASASAVGPVGGHRQVPAGRARVDVDHAGDPTVGVAGRIGVRDRRLASESAESSMNRNMR